jgi:lipopolysaccharide/colanic/teichoic acid biosynthesis glycosyltransferase
VTIRADVVDGVVPVVEACKAEDGFFYIKNRSIVLDLYTIFETVKDLVSGGGS